MEASKAEEIATSPDELQDLQDDQLIHQQTEPEPEPELEDELTNDIERDPPKQPRAKRPRTKAHPSRQRLSNETATHRNELGRGREDCRRIHTRIPLV